MTAYPILDRGTHAVPPNAPLAAAAGGAADAARPVRAGVNVVVAYHSSVLRRRGLPSVSGLLPWAGANDLAMAILPEIAEAVVGLPVFITVCANDALRLAAVVVVEAAALGAHGVLNAPTVGLLSGLVRRELEVMGLGFKQETEFMSVARGHGLKAWGYAFGPGQARALVGNGAEAVVVHLGITGSRQPIHRAARTLAVTADIARVAGRKVHVLAHGVQSLTRRPSLACAQKLLPFTDFWGSPGISVGRGLG